MLRSQGLLGALGAADAGTVHAPAYAPERDDTGHRSGWGCCTWTGTWTPGISDAVDAVAGEVPALAARRGHPALGNLEGRGPLVADADATRASPCATPT